MFLRWKAAIGIGVACSLCAGIALIAASLFKAAPSREFAQMVAAFELQRVHWSWWNPEHREFVGKMADDLVADASRYKWDARFMFVQPGISFIPTDVKPDEFETAAIDAMQQDGDEVLQKSTDGTWRYVAVLRARDSCRACHRRFVKNEGSLQLQDDAPLAYTSIQIRPK